MTVSWTLVLAGFLTAQAGEPAALRYVRPAGDKYVLESEVSYTKTKAGTRYISTTHRPGVKMKLTIVLNKSGVVQSAETVLQSAKRTKKAQATFRGKMVRIVRSKTDTQELAFDRVPVVVTTAPDWSDILFLMRQCDFQKKGKQEFAGLWFHPTTAAHKRTFVVERLGRDVIQAKGKKVMLGRFRVTLRSGDYVVWADGDGLVYRLGRPGRRGGVFLTGYEKATKDLR